MSFFKFGTMCTSRDLTAKRLLFYPEGVSLLEAFNHVTGRIGFFHYTDTVIQEVPERAGWIEQQELLEGNVISCRNNVIYEVYAQQLRRMLIILDPYETKELEPAPVYTLESERVDVSPSSEPDSEDVETEKKEYTSADLSAHRIHFFDNGRDDVLLAYNNETDQMEHYIFTDTYMREVPPRNGYRHSKNLWHDGSTFSCSNGTMYTMCEGRIQKMFCSDGKRIEMEPVPVYALKDAEDRMISTLAEYMEELETTPWQSKIESTEKEEDVSESAGNGSESEGFTDDDGPWGTETYLQEEEEVSDSSEVGSSDSDPESEDDEDEEEDVEEDEDSDSDESCETALEPSDGEDDISFDDVESCMTAVEPSDDDYSIVDSDSEDVDPEAAGASSGEDASTCTIC